MGIRQSVPALLWPSALPVVFRASGGRCHADSGGPSEGPSMKKKHKVGIAIVGFIVLLYIIGLVTGGGKATPTSNTSPITSASAVASTVASPTATAKSAPAHAAAAKKARAKPRRTAVPATPAPATSKAVAPPPPPPTTSAPAAAPSTPSSCYPLTNGGNCYEPGEYCRNSDHGTSGVAGDGKRIICEDNDGWRWEPV